MSTLTPSAEIRLSFPPRAEYLELVAQVVTATARRVGFPEREAARLRLAVDEACANAIEHGPPDQPVTVVCRETVTGLIIRVEDRGPWFDPAAVPPPLVEAPLEKRRIGGLGLHLIQRVMESMEILPMEGGKAVEMTKSLPGREGDDGD